MKKLLSLTFLALIGALLVFSSCEEDDPDPETPDAPSVTAPDPTSVQVGNSITVSFTISAPGGYASASAAPFGGTATITSEPDEDATSGTVEVEFTAGDTEGAGSIVLTVTDANGETDDATATISIGDVELTYTLDDVTETREIGGEEVEFPQTRITGTINQDLTLTNDVAWVLNGRVIVAAGATLTIDPGTIIKGTEGEGALSSVLLVARGATILANGEEGSPIVFTSVQDDINVGEFESTLDLETDGGLWGGVLILGNAPIVAGAAEEQIEGIPTSVPEGLYGGSDPEDNSGSFTYVSIRFTGTQLGPGNELQGLTLGGVGSETTIDNVESINSDDDGVEIFGGTVNITNFIVWGQDDDGYDVDQGYKGTIDNFVYIGATGGRAGDHAFELDGPEGEADGTEIGVFRNGSVRGNKSSDFVDLRDGAQYDLQNIYFFDFPEGSEIALNPGDDGDDPGSSNNYANGLITLENLEFAQSSLDGGADFVIGAIFNDKLDATTQDDQAAAEAQIEANGELFIDAENNNTVVTTQGVGADITPLMWSLAGVMGELDAFNDID